MSKGEPGFQKVANKMDIKEGSLLGVELEGNKIEGFNLTCPWHYAVFDVRNGKVSDRTVWAKNQASYPVNIDESTGDILINVRAGIRQKGGKEATDSE
jgi:nitrite reductase/ring-hydroxylating ferredoxin subunit